METPEPIPCPICREHAAVCQDHAKPGHFYVGCSDEFGCPQWPVTHARPSREEAIADWNSGKTI